VAEAQREMGEADVYMSVDSRDVRLRRVQYYYSSITWLFVENFLEVLTVDF
jgi:hypothetical protein